MSGISNLQHTFENALAATERTLNLFGYVPFVSTVSGGLRIIYGKVEIITGLALSAIGIVGALCKQGSDRKSAMDQADSFFKYSIHGLANVARGLVESVPFVNLVCFFWDQANERMAYPSELCQRQIHQLNPHP